ANRVASAQDLLPYYALVFLVADRMDKRRGVYTNTVVGYFNCSAATGAVRNPFRGFFVELRCGLFQLLRRDRMLLHEDRLLVCGVNVIVAHCYYVVNIIVAQCEHVVNRFFGASRSFFASSGAAAHVLAWCWHGMGGRTPPRPRRRDPRRTMGPRWALANFARKNMV